MRWPTSRMLLGQAVGRQPWRATQFSARPSVGRAGGRPSGQLLRVAPGVGQRRRPRGARRGRARPRAPRAPRPRRRRRSAPRAPRSAAARTASRCRATSCSASARSMPDSTNRPMTDRAPRGPRPDRLPRAWPPRRVVELVGQAGGHRAQRGQALAVLLDRRDTRHDRAELAHDPAVHGALGEHQVEEGVRGDQREQARGLALDAHAVVVLAQQRDRAQPGRCDLRAHGLDAPFLDARGAQRALEQQVEARAAARLPRR